MIGIVGLVTKEEAEAGRSAGFFQLMPRGVGPKIRHSAMHASPSSGAYLTLTENGNYSCETKSTPSNANRSTAADRISCANIPRRTHVLQPQLQVILAPCLSLPAQRRQGHA